MVSEEGIEQYLKIAGAFSPAAPITTSDLFRGRTDQLIALTDACGTKGQHAIVFGERGVGKTSLARTGEAIFSAAHTQRWTTVFVTCDGSDNYTGVWRKIESEINTKGRDAERKGLADQAEAMSEAAFVLDDGAQESNGEILPDHARRALRVLCETGPTAIFVDEFDRITDSDTNIRFADTVKILSDHGIPATIVIVGVARSVSDLISAHESIARSLVEIPMPRMDHEEIESILQEGFDHIGLDYEEAVLERVVSLALGLPHFAHLLGKCLAQVAVRDDSDVVSLAHLDKAVGIAIDSSNQSLRDGYFRATSSNKKVSLFEPVLISAALAPVDESGFFAPADLKEPLSKLTGKDYGIESFNRHLAEFASDGGARGQILERTGLPRRYRYRFADPQLQPYVVLRATAAGRVTNGEIRPEDQGDQLSLEET